MTRPGLNLYPSFSPNYPFQSINDIGSKIHSKYPLIPIRIVNSSDDMKFQRGEKSDYEPENGMVFNLPKSEAFYTISHAGLQPKLPLYP
jgi:hypothetical protein